MCAETIGGAWEVRLEKNMERVRAMIGISFYLYEVGSARAPKGFPWWTAGMKIDPRVPNTLIRKDYSLVNLIGSFSFPLIRRIPNDVFHNCNISKNANFLWEFLLHFINMLKIFQVYSSLLAQWLRQTSYYVEKI